MPGPAKPDLIDLAAAVLRASRSAGHKIATAESCTGGLIAACMTAVAGSSDVVDRGFVSYSNHSKTDMLGVPASLIASQGAVSAPVARAMAEAALRVSRASIALSVTGIAGPGGGTATKPVGLVFSALARSGGETEVLEHRFEGDRTAVRQATVEAVFRHVLRSIGRE